MEILQANRILSNLRSAVVARDRERHTRHVHMTDQDALLLFHAHHEQVPFVLSGHQHGVRWKRLVDTSNAEAQEDRKQLGAEKWPTCRRKKERLRRTSRRAE